MGPEPEKMERPVKKIDDTYCGYKAQGCEWLVKNNELEAEVSRLTGENKKLRDDLGLTMSEERKLRTENVEHLARIAELESQNQQLKSDGSNESRITAIEKWLVDWTCGKDLVNFPFKPGGE